MTAKMPLLSATLALAVAAAAPGLAQDTGGAAAPAEGQGVLSPDALSLGESETDNGAYLAATHGDWELRCLRTEEGDDPCQLYQLLKDAEGNPTAEFILFPLPPGREAAAGATIITPLETLLTQQITIRVDGAPGKRYPFSWCAPIGCIARVGFTAQEIDAFKRGRAATLTIFPVAAPDTPVELSVSLTGFTAGFDALAATLKAPAPAGQ